MTKYLPVCTPGVYKSELPDTTWIVVSIHKTRNEARIAYEEIKNNYSYGVFEKQMLEEKR